MCFKHQKNPIELLGNSFGAETIMAIAQSLASCAVISFAERTAISNNT